MLLVYLNVQSNLRNAETKIGTTETVDRITSDQGEYVKLWRGHSRATDVIRATFYAALAQSNTMDATGVHDQLKVDYINISSARLVVMLRVSVLVSRLSDAQCPQCINECGRIECQVIRGRCSSPLLGSLRTPIEPKGPGLVPLLPHTNCSLDY